MERKVLIESEISSNKLKSLFLAALLGFVISCSSSPKYIEMGDLGKNSRAPGSAYAADAMYIQPLMKSHADWEPQPFYFKECSEIGEKAYYSKTYYECNSGPFQ